MVFVKGTLCFLIRRYALQFPKQNVVLYYSVLLLTPTVDILHLYFNYHANFEGISQDKEAMLKFVLSILTQ
jgi:hypothetical protein